MFHLMYYDRHCIVYIVNKKQVKKKFEVGMAVTKAPKQE